MRVLGVVLAVLGGLIVLVSLNMDTTVTTGSGLGRVHNIGLLNQRSNTLLTGAVLAVVGVLMLLLGRRPPARDTAQMRACPYCAEQIQATAVVCRFCKHELRPAAPLSQEQEMHLLGITYADGAYWWSGQRFYRLSAAREAAQQQPQVPASDG